MNDGVNTNIHSPEPVSRKGRPPYKRLRSACEMSRAERRQSLPSTQVQWLIYLNQTQQLYQQWTTKQKRFVLLTDYTFAWICCCISCYIILTWSLQVHTAQSGGFVSLLTSLGNS